MISFDQMPPPSCRLGYTERDLVEKLGFGDIQLRHFQFWMRGQTTSLCDGRTYNHATQQYELSECDTAHGVVVYVDDVWRFLNRIPVID